MNTADEMKNNLSKKIDGFNMQLVYVQDLLAVYNQITDLKNNLLQHSENFTLIAECAFYDSFVMALARLYDKSKQTETIQNLLDSCLENVHLINDGEYAKKINDFKTRLDNDEYITPAINTISFRRDKMYAHNDKKFFGKKISSDRSYLPMYQLWFLVDFTNEVLSYLSTVFNLQMSKTKYNNDILNSLEQTL